MTEAFTKIGADFKAANPNAGTTFNFGSSGTLETQIQQSSGAGVDTFASADEDNMNKLVSASLIDGTPTVFAKNKLVIVTKPGNPKNVKTLADLTKADVVSLCGLDGPVRQVRGADPADCRGDDPGDQGHARRGREGDARGGHDRRRRRRDRLRHRREERGQHRRRGRHPRRAERDRDVPDRDLKASANAGDVAGVHRLRHVVEGPGDAQVVRLPPAVVSRRGRRVPWIAVLVALVGFAFIALPLVGLIQQVPWGNLWSDLSDPEATSRAAPVGHLLALGDGALASIFGVPLAWVLAAVTFPGRALVRALVLLPMVLPPVVGGVGLFYAFGRNGLVGQ